MVMEGRSRAGGRVRNWRGGEVVEGEKRDRMRSGAGGRVRSGRGGEVGQGEKWGRVRSGAGEG